MAWVIDASLFGRMNFSTTIMLERLGGTMTASMSGTGAPALARRLLRFLTANKEIFPLAHPEDDLLSWHYRPVLEKHGFRWAPEQLASRFMFECTGPRPTPAISCSTTASTSPSFLIATALPERLRLMFENAYLQE